MEGTDIREVEHYVRRTRQKLQRADGMRGDLQEILIWIRNLEVYGIVRF